MKWVLLSLLAALSSGLRADVVELTNGNKMECTVLSETAERVTVRKGAGTFSVPRSQVVSITRLAPAATQPVGGDGLPTLDQVVTALSKQDWGKGLEQIPATVIDKGVLQNVPYVSHRAGDYEVNVYGNPDAPAGLEIGIYKAALTAPGAKDRCIQFVSALIGKERASKLARLDPQKDSRKVGQWTIEITPPMDTDAYGGWWVSVYSEPQLEKSRASAEELKSITVARQTETVEAQKASAQAGAVRPASGDDWTPTEMGRARGAASGASGGGAVYVRGYTRKDGTYVRGYTRSAPGHGGGRR